MHGNLPGPFVEGLPDDPELGPPIRQEFGYRNHTVTDVKRASKARAKKVKIRNELLRSTKLLPAIGEGNIVLVKSRVNGAVEWWLGISLKAHSRRVVRGITGLDVDMGNTDDEDGAGGEEDDGIVDEEGQEDDGVGSEDDSVGELKKIEVSNKQVEEEEKGDDLDGGQIEVQWLHPTYPKDYTVNGKKKDKKDIVEPNDLNVIFTPWFIPAPNGKPKKGIPNTEFVSRAAVALIGVKIKADKRIYDRCKKDIADLEVGFVLGANSYLVYNESLGRVAC